MARKESGIFDKVYTNKSPKTNKTVYRYRFYWYESPESKTRKYGYSDYSSTKEVARQNAQRKIDEKFSKPKENNTKLTIEQIAQKYIDYVSNLEISEKVRPTSQASLVSNINTLVLNKDGKGRNIAHIPSELRKRKICDLTTADVGNWVNYILTTKSYKTGERLGENTIKKLKKTIRKLIIFANQQLHCFVDDSDRATLLYQKTSEGIFTVNDTPSPKDKSNRVLDEKTFRIFMKTRFTPNGVLTESVFGEKGDPIDRRYEYYILLSLFFYSGARISEVKPLLITDINWEKNDNPEIKLPNRDQANISFTKTYSEKCLKNAKEKHRQLNDFMKTSRSKRMIPIYGILASELFSYTRYLKSIYGRDYKGLLFPGEELTFLSSNAIQHQIDMRTKNLFEFGIDKLSPHDFRASRVTEFLATGLNPEDIYWFFGHNSKRLVDGCYKRLKPQKEYEEKKDFADTNNFGAEQQKKIIEKQLLEQMKYKK